jgi:hypothetical protein
VQRQTGHFPFGVPLAVIWEFCTSSPIEAQIRAVAPNVLLRQLRWGDFCQQLPCFWTRGLRKTLFIGPPCCDLSHCLEVLPLHLLVFSIGSCVRRRMVNEIVPACRTVRKQGGVYGQARRQVLAFLLPSWKWEGLDASNGVDLPLQLLVCEILDIGHDTDVCVEIMIELIASPRKAADKAAVNERRNLAKDQPNLD